MKAMVLAAGEGTRLRPLTLRMPKPMLPVAGRPTLEWIFLWLRYYGIREIVVNLCHQPEPVLQYFGDGAAGDLQLTFSVEQDMLGTAGGIKRVAGLFGEPFVVIYGDVLTDMDLGELVRLHATHGAPPHATLSLCQAAKPWECGIVGVDPRGQVTQFVEKPARDAIFSHFTNAGVLVVDPALLEYIPADSAYDIGRDLLPDLLRRQVPLFAHVPPEPFYLIDIGTPEKYQRVQQEWPTTAAKHYLGASR
jgi:NDP-sugar pyrophosphorylase family protein